MSNIQPPRPNSGSTVVTIVDPKLVDEMKAVKRDTEAILAAMEKNEPDKPAENPVPRYFPRGYFP